MADNVNISANVETILKYLENNSQVKNIDVTDIESIFEQVSPDNKDVSTEEFINTFNEYFMIDTTDTNVEIIEEEYLAALSKIAESDGNSKSISAEDIDTLNDAIEEYHSNSQTKDSFNIDDLDMSKWTEIESKENKTLFGKSKGTYTYTASNRTKVTVENSEGIQILENNETGEILVIGAKGAEINGSGKDNTITVYDSEINSIETGKGADNIKVYNSTVDTIKSGKGTDSIYINDSTVESLNTGAGSDFVSVTNSDTTKINTSSSFLWGILDSGEDTVMLNDSTAETLKTGRGDDTVIAKDSSVTTLKSGRGSDSLSLAETEVETLKTNDKDTVIKDSNYLDFDTSKISKLKSDVEIKLSDDSTITLSDYTDYILNQKVGFETEEEYQEYVIETMTNNIETMKSVYQTQENNDGIVSDGYNILKELSGLGISSNDVQTYIEEQEATIEGLTAAMNGKSSMSFKEAYEYYTGATYSQEKIDKYIEVSNTYSAVMTGCQYDEDYADKFEEAVGISVNDLAAEFALCQTETFGQTSELQELVDKYSEDQESFKDNISAVISTTGIVCMVAGAVICVACPVAAGAGIALMNTGKTISLTGMFIDNGLDLVDDSTDADGLTKEEAADIAFETGVEAVSYAAGRGIGKLTNGLNTVVANKVSDAGAGKIVSYVAGQTAETTADTVLSLGADYAIAQGQSYITTGEFMDTEDYWSLERFTGEGKNQLIGILTGLASSKVSAYQQTAIATAQTKVLSGDTEGARASLEASGIKTTDASFDDFVEQVKAVDIQAMDTGAEKIDTNTRSEAVSDDISAEKFNSFSQNEIDMELKNIGISDEIIRVAKDSNFTSEQYANLAKLKSLGINDYVAACFVSNSDSPDISKVESNINALKDVGFDIKYLSDNADFNILYLSENGISNLKSLKNEGFSDSTIASISKDISITNFSESQLSAFISLTDDVKYFNGLFAVARGGWLTDIPNIHDYYDSYNLILNGERLDSDLYNRFDEIGNKYGVEIKLDNDAVSESSLRNTASSKIISEKYISDVEKALKQMTDEGINIPDTIYLSSFLKGSDSAGGFSYRNPGEIIVNTKNSDTLELTITIYHETGHLNDFAKGNNQYFNSEKRAWKGGGMDMSQPLSYTFSNGEKVTVTNSDISNIIRWYANTNVKEFVAEVGALKTNGTIIKSNDGTYTIDTNNIPILYCNGWKGTLDDYKKLNVIMEYYNMFTN